MFRPPRTSLPPCGADPESSSLTTLAAVTTASTSSPVWPTWPAHAGFGAISAKVDIVAGQRYWLQLHCPTPSGGAAGCAAGARFHTGPGDAPYALSLRHRRLASRTKSGGSCKSITDRDACCASIDATTGSMCVPAITVYTSVAGTPSCLDAPTAASEDHRGQIAACPARVDARGAARPRTTLGNQVSCASITDRHACCSAIDGGTSAVRAGYACVPAATLFQNGNLCETARYAEMYDPLSAASCAEFRPAAAPLAFESLHHEVQTLTLQQLGAVKQVQFVTFAGIECNLTATADCTDREGVTDAAAAFVLGATTGPKVPLNASSEDIAAGFAPLINAGSSYGGLDAAVELANMTHVIWRLELLTAWEACANQLALPLVEVTAYAKVDVTVTRGSAGSCLSGGVGLGLGGTTAHLPWDATEAKAEAAISSLLPDGSGVMVHRSGDGHEFAVFAITFLGAGDWAALTVDDSALHRSQLLLNGSYGANAAAAANASIAEVVPGGLDVTPLPGRYLTAPTNTSVASVRLVGTSTALCAAPDWDALHEGCYAAPFLGSAASLTDLSLEKCAHSCGSGYRAIAAHGNNCYCLSSPPTTAAAAAVNCSTPCAADAAQLCGGDGDGRIVAMSITVAGDVELLNTTFKSDIAIAAGVDPSYLRLHATPSASRLDVSIDVPALANAQGTPMWETVQAALNDKMGTAALATAVLGTTVASNPSIFLGNFASVYRMPSTLSTDAEDGVILACLSQRDAAVTPHLYAVTPQAAAFNSTLTLVGANLTVNATAKGVNGTRVPLTPTVSVCGGVACPVTLHNATHVQCRMPMCAAVANATTLLHVPPHGYARPHGDTAVRAVLSLSSVALKSNATTLAEGSAAGGLTLVLRGVGFADEPARMAVSLRHGGGHLAQCEVLASSTADGVLECRTWPATLPLVAAGKLCAVQVQALDEANATAVHASRGIEP